MPANFIAAFPLMVEVEGVNVAMTLPEFMGAKVKFVPNPEAVAAAMVAPVEVVLFVIWKTLARVVFGEVEPVDEPVTAGVALDSVSMGTPGKHRAGVADTLVVTEAHRE